MLQNAGIRSYFQYNHFFRMNLSNVLVYFAVYFFVSESFLVSKKLFFDRIKDGTLFDSFATLNEL